MRGIEKYQDQLARVKRWHERFEEIDQGSKQSRSSDYYVDEVHAFFVNCYHLKDWLIKDTNLKVSKERVENFIDSHIELQVCADICNGLKHFLRDRDPRSGNDPEFISQSIKIQLGGKIPTTSMSFTIKISEDENRDAFELATQCVALWEITRYYSRPVANGYILYESVNLKDCII